MKAGICDKPGISTRVNKQNTVWQLLSWMNVAETVVAWSKDHLGQLGEASQGPWLLGGALKGKPDFSRRRGKGIGVLCKWAWSEHPRV